MVSKSSISMTRMPPALMNVMLPARSITLIQSSLADRISAMRATSIVFANATSCGRWDTVFIVYPIASVWISVSKSLSAVSELRVQGSRETAVGECCGEFPVVQSVCVTVQAARR